MHAITLQCSLIISTKLDKSSLLTYVYGSMDNLKRGIRKSCSRTFLHKRDEHQGYSWWRSKISCDTRFPTKWYRGSSKPQNSLRIRAV